jgi:uncharacterized protein
MLHRYGFSNFQSFAEWTEVDLRLNAKTQQVGWERLSKGGQRLSTAMAVVGANASGKTALLKPLALLEWFVKHSFQAPAEAPLPVVPHFNLPGSPTEMEFEGEDLDGKLWRYELKLTAERVVHEALFSQKVRGFSYVFIRAWDAPNERYSIRQQGFGMKPAEAIKVRQNASLVATAAQYGVPLALRFQRLHVQTNVLASGRRRFDAESDLPASANYFAADSAARDQMVDLLKAWDLGLSGVELREVATRQEPGQEPVRSRFPFGIHANRQGQESALSFFEESSGTQSAFFLLSKLLPALLRGGLAVIDEFESDLHPLMLEPILDLFAHEQTNPKGAQILFTCHAMEVLNLLHKSQVTLVEKDANCESSAWRMDEVKDIRNDHNFYAKYMAGAYGAVPNL